MCHQSDQRFDPLTSHGTLSPNSKEPKDPLLLVDPISMTPPYSRASMQTVSLHAALIDQARALSLTPALGPCGKRRAPAMTVLVAHARLPLRAFARCA